jgi:hypothetical protein
MGDHNVTLMRAVQAGGVLGERLAAVDADDCVQTIAREIGFLPAGLGKRERAAEARV